MTITLLPRMTVDFELLMANLLAYPGLFVLPRVDADSLDNLPLLTFAGADGVSVGNGPPGSGWRWSLYLSLYVESMEQGGSVADTVYQIVHGMEETGIADVGSVVSVEDVAMFDRIGGADIDDRRVVQYNATFEVIVIPA